MNNYINNISNNVVNATSARRLCNALRECQNVLESRFVNKAAFMEQLQRAMREQATFYKNNIPAIKIMERTLSNVFIYEDKLSYLIYSSFKINSCTKIEELRGEISNIIDFFENYMTSPKTEVLSQSEIIDMLNIVHSKYNLFDAETFDKELEIYVLNKSHICYDSLIITFKNTYTGTMLNKYIVFSLSPCVDILACNKYFVFLHEIGHIFYNSITKGSNRVPESFKQLAVLLGLPFLDNENRLSELFADIFSACTINNSKYSYYNPFKTVLSDEILEVFELYFNMLAYQVNTEIYNLAVVK